MRLSVMAAVERINMTYDSDCTILEVNEHRYKRWTLTETYVYDGYIEFVYHMSGQGNAQLTRTCIAIKESDFHLFGAHQTYTYIENELDRKEKRFYGHLKEG